jgi:hypothetical protein
VIIAGLLGNFGGPHKVIVGDEVVRIGAIKDENLDVRCFLDLRPKLSQFEEGLWIIKIDRWILERGAPVARRFFHNTELFEALKPEDDRLLGHLTFP